MDGLGWPCLVGEGMEAISSIDPRTSRESTLLSYFARRIFLFEYRCPAALPLDCQGERVSA